MTLWFCYLCGTGIAYTQLGFEVMLLAEMRSLCRMREKNAKKLNTFLLLGGGRSGEGRDSSVGIATRDGLDGPGIESRREAKFSAPVQNGPGPHPASCTTGTGSFPGVKCGRGVALTIHPDLTPG